MKYIAPAYYRHFKCIASACKHSCCIGWEVDVDGEALALYDGMTHPYATHIRESIDYADTPHFALADGERCPHLAPSGLCNIITECGEQALCQICRDHPRYRNFYDGVTEIGLGLSCEEAARLALSEDVGFLVSDSENMSGAELTGNYPAGLFSDEELGVMKEKNRLLSQVCNNGIPIEKRVESLLPVMLDFEEIRSLFLSLEPLDVEWNSRIKALSAKDFNRDLNDHSDLIERTICAFIYRHLSCESFYSPAVIAAFSALSALLVAALVTDASDFTDTLRAYSAEVEYSTENTEKILDFIEERLILNFR